MFFANSFSGVLALVYQLFMVRNLEPAEFAVLNTLLTLMILTAMPSGMVQTVSAKFVATFNAAGNLGKVGYFLRLFLYKLFAAGLVIFFLFFAFRGQIADFFNIENGFLLVITGLALMFSLMFPFVLGGLQGLQKFYRLGAIGIANVSLKLILGIALVSMGYRISGAMGAVAISSFTALALCLFSLKNYIWGRKSRGKEGEDLSIDLKSIYKYSLPVFFAIPSYMFLTTMDLVFVQKLLPDQAGFYAVAQMFGKIVIFLPSAIFMVMFPKLTESYTRKENTGQILYKSLIATGLLSFSAAAVGIMFPALVIRLLSGQVYPQAIPLVAPFSISMGFFALSGVMLYYHLSVHNLKMVNVFMAAVLLEAALIMVFHETLLQVLYVLIGVSVSLFLVNLISVKLFKADYESA